MKLKRYNLTDQDVIIGNQASVDSFQVGENGTFLKVGVNLIGLLRIVALDRLK